MGQEKIILQKRNAEKEVVRLSQEYDLLDQKVREKREEATTLVAKLKVPYLKGWHYTADKGWLWTDLDYYPIVYSNAEDAWIHYDQGTSNPWHYYNYSTQEWFEWNQHEVPINKLDKCKIMSTDENYQILKRF